MSVISRVRWSVVAFLAILFVITTGATPIVAGSLREGSTLSNGVSAGGPGEALWTYYDLTGAAGGAGDNILTLINPNGSANPTLIGRASDACAMIYVFDDDQEMGECCGCPLTSAQLATFSVLENLTSNWGLTHPPESVVPNPDNGLGAIAIVAAAPNAPACNGQSVACNGGCDPTNVPGYTVSSANNLLGTMTHNEYIDTGSSSVSGITETGLFDDGQGNEENELYLQFQCGIMVGNGSGGGTCNCPIEPGFGSGPG